MTPGATSFEARGEESSLSLCATRFRFSQIFPDFNSENSSHALLQPGANRITVVVLKARNLPKMDITGLSGEKIHKSKMKIQNENPKMKIQKWTLQAYQVRKSSCVVKLQHLLVYLSYS